MVDKVTPYLINMGEIIPARSQATLLNELAMALIECVGIYSKSLKKLGRLSKISTAFWPVRLVPLSDTRACVMSYLYNKQEKLNVGKFAQMPPRPEAVIKGADLASFLGSLRQYNTTYLKKSRNFKRGLVIQEALFNTSEVGYFQSFFLNQYNLSSHSSPYFLLEGGPIAKSVNQAKIVPSIPEFVAQKDVALLESFADGITKLCERWIQKGSKDADKIRDTKVDTGEEEKQLAILNKEIQAEKERTIEKTPEELVKSGKYKINDKTGELNNNLSAIKSAVDGLRNAINQRDLFLTEEGLKDINIKYTDLGNSIARYDSEIAQLRKNVQREISDQEKTKQQKIRELEHKKAEVEKQIEAKHSGLSKDLTSAEDIVAQINTEKQSSLDNIEKVKDKEMTDVQDFFNNYTLELKTQNTVVGIPIYIFYFIDPNTNRTTERAPVLPILIDNGRIVSTKVKASFRKKLRDLMNKDNAMIDLVESQGDKNNLMEMKNLDTRLEDGINDLRIRKILNKKQAETAKSVISDLVW
ncbi:MAG: coiled-coil domain-containing protein [Candidatus Heimdallarchaeota archaeon]